MDSSQNLPESNNPTKYPSLPPQNIQYTPHSSTQNQLGQPFIEGQQYPPQLQNGQIQESLGIENTPEYKMAQLEIMKLDQQLQGSGVYLCYYSWFYLVIGVFTIGTLLALISINFISLVTLAAEAFATFYLLRAMKTKNLKQVKESLIAHFALAILAIIAPYIRPYSYTYNVTYYYSNALADVSIFLLIMNMVFVLCAYKDLKYRATLVEALGLCSGNGSTDTPMGIHNV